MNRLKVITIFLVSILLSTTLVYADDNDEKDKILSEMQNYVSTQEYDKAIIIYQRNESLLFDKGMYEMAASFWYGMCLTRQGKYEEALTTLKRTIAILDADYEYVITQKNISFLSPYYIYAQVSSFVNKKKAIELYRKAKQVYEDAGFQSNEQYLKICEFLLESEYEKEIKRINEIILSVNDDLKRRNIISAETKVDICLKMLDEMSIPWYLMNSTLNLIQGRIAASKEDFNKAEVAYLNGIKVIAPYTESDADCLQLSIKLYVDLGAVYGRIHDDKNGYLIMKNVKQKLEEIGDLGYDYARCLQTLAAIDISHGKNLTASIYLETAGDILSKIGTVQPESLASLYGSLSCCYLNMGNQEEALAAVKKAHEYTNGFVSPSTLAQVESNYGTIHLYQRNFKEAKKCYEKAVSIIGNSSESPLVRFNLAYLLFLTKDKSLINIVITNSQMLQENVLSSFLFLSKYQRMSYWDNIGMYLNAYNRYLYDGNILSAKEYGTIYNNALFSKGLLLRMSNLASNTILNAMSQSDNVKLQKLNNYQNLMSSEFLPLDSIEFYQNKTLELEKELLRNNLSYIELKKNLLIDWHDIKKVLGKGETAIEFIQLPRMEKECDLKWEYAAIIINSETKDPIIVSICNHDSLTTILGQSTEVSNIPSIHQNMFYRAYIYMNGNYKGKIGSRNRIITTNGNALYSLIWKKLENYLFSAKKIYYSPIGILNNIAFAALTEDSIPLIDRYDLQLVSSTSEIINIKRRSENYKNSVVYGGIKYDVSSDSLLAESRNYGSISRETYFSVGERTGMPFLEGSVNEVQAINTKLKKNKFSCRLLMNVSANEESFKSLSGKSPDLLHIATHGFFLSEEKEIQSSKFLHAVNLHVPSTEHVMNRSGLLFAGANRALRGKDLVDGIEDGILTAYEISNLDLRSTKMVVLSACETGLGENKASEGVFGLQRAFKLAGVKTLIMSLWKVPDAETSQLMQLFYDCWLNGMEKHQAFVKAQRKLKETNPNPYFWAGFVMLD